MSNAEFNKDDMNYVLSDDSSLDVEAALNQLIGKKAALEALMRTLEEGDVLLDPTYVEKMLSLIQNRLSRSPQLRIFKKLK